MHICHLCSGWATNSLCIKRISWPEEDLASNLVEQTHKYTKTHGCLHSRFFDASTLNTPFLLLLLLTSFFSRAIFIPVSDDFHCPSMVVLAAALILYRNVSGQFLYITTLHVVYIPLAVPRCTLNGDLRIRFTGVIDLCYIICRLVYLHYPKCFQQCSNPEKSPIYFKVTWCFILIAF